MGRARVLVVDDDKAVRMLAAVTLSAAGFDVLEAADGPQALSIAETQQFDLVVLDNSMPGMNGRDVARALREDARHSTIPILMLSALASDEEQWEGWRAGVDIYVTKPYDGDVLVAHVRRLLAQRSPYAGRR